MKKKHPWTDEDQFTVETIPKDVVFEKSTSSSKKDVSIRVAVDLEESLEPADLTDDGLIFLAYNLEHDEVLVELGEEPTAAYYNAACALENPVSYLIDQCTWLGDACWGLVLCDWAAEALSLSSADMHIAMLKDLEVARSYWMGDCPLSDVETILSKRLWKKYIRASSGSQLYDRWFDNTSSLAIMAMKFPINADPNSWPTRGNKRLEELTKHLLNAWHSLIVATVGKKLLESKRKGDWQEELAKINTEKEAAKIYATATLRKIREYQDLGYVEEYIECHCNKQDFLLTVGLDKIKSIEAWSYDDPWEDYDD